MFLQIFFCYFFLLVSFILSYVFCEFYCLWQLASHRPQKIIWRFIKVKDSCDFLHRELLWLLPVSWGCQELGQNQIICTTLCRVAHPERIDLVDKFV